MSFNTSGNSGNIKYVHELFNIVKAVPGLSKEDALSQLDKWIDIYANIKSHKFAVIKIGGESIDPEKGLSKDFTEAMGILSRLDLFPYILYGWGNDLTKRLKKKGIESRFDQETGDRLTMSKKEVNEVKKIAHEYGSSLVKNLIKNDIKAKLIENAFEGEPIYHFTGEITAVNSKTLENAIYEHYVPVVSPLAWYKEGKTFLNINADTAASKLAIKICPSKLIYLTEKGYIADENGKRISGISTKEECHRLRIEGIIKGGMKKKLFSILDYLVCNKAGNVAQIASPSNLIIELFTEEGAGTYVNLES